MSQACPVPTPVERQYGAIQDRIRDDMVRTVYAALREAAERAEHEMWAAGLDLPPPSQGYFAAVMHQSLFCTLCEADPDTFAGGRADIAAAVIRNSRNIARHDWGADLGPEPRD